jgi:hypothetical protein
MQCDDTINIHPDLGPNNCDDPRGWTQPEDSVLVRYVFVEIVTESEICHIYKTVFLTIKIAVHNVSRAHRKQTTQAPNKSANNAITSIIQRNWMYGCYSSREPEPV